MRRVVTHTFDHFSQLQTIKNLSRRANSKCVDFKLFHHFVLEIHFVDLKILPSDWPSEFWPISQEPKMGFV